MLDLDERGVPGVMIATTAFAEAAAAQSKSLGFEPAIVYVPHPIQNKTREELHALATGCSDAVLTAIMQP